MIQRLQIKELTHHHHDEIENRLQKDGQELCRLLFQSALDVMASHEERRESVTGDDALIRTHFRKDCGRNITSIFGGVRHRRMGYSHPLSGSLYPLD